MYEKLEDSRAERILEATERLLSGKPKRVQQGRLSVLALAEEAGVGRATLYRGPYIKLRQSFEDRVQLRSRRPESGDHRLGLEYQLEQATREIDELKASLKGQVKLAAGLAQELSWVWDRWQDAERRAGLASAVPREQPVIPIRGRQK